MSKIITFYCPHCGVKLEVPDTYAGVEAPCPECQSIISAPLSSANLYSDEDNIDFDTSSEKELNNFSQETSSTTLSNSSLKETRYRGLWIVFFTILSLGLIISGILLVLQLAGLINTFDFLFKKESIKANFSHVSEKKEEIEGVKTLNNDTFSQKKEGGDSYKKEPSKIIRTNSSHKEKEEKVDSLDVESIKDRKKEKELEPHLKEGELPTFEAPALNETASNLKEVTEREKMSLLAMDTLRQFLLASNLKEREPYLSKTSLSVEEQKKSSLNKPLLKIASIEPLENTSFDKGSILQYLYLVSFKSENGVSKQPILIQLVERPGVHPPRIHGDAFVEHYDGRLLEYSQHSERHLKQNFHCIAEARTANLSLEIPEELRSKMIRIVIKSTPMGEPIFNAYLKKNSPLMEQIGYQKNFPYTVPRFCVMSFRWNIENEKYPYIELCDILQYGWEL